MCAYLNVSETPERRPSRLPEKTGDFEIYDVISYKNEASAIFVSFSSLDFLFAIAQQCFDECAAISQFFQTFKNICVIYHCF